MPAVLERMRSLPSSVGGSGGIGPRGEPAISNFQAVLVAKVSAVGGYMSGVGAFSAAYVPARSF